MQRDEVGKLFQFFILIATQRFSLIRGKVLHSRFAVRQNVFRLPTGKAVMLQNRETTLAPQNLQASACSQIHYCILNVAKPDSGEVLDD